MIFTKNHQSGHFWEPNASKRYNSRRQTCFCDFKHTWVHICKVCFPACKVLWYLILSLSIFLKHVIQINNVELCIVFVNFRKWCHCPVLQVILSRQFLSQIQSSPLLSYHQSHRVIVQNSWNLCFCFIRFFEGFFMWNCYPTIAINMKQ